MSDMGGSIGAARVRESFNPSQDNVVDKIKRYTADLIDICEELRRIDPSPEQQRLVSLAQTVFEEAAMWAVKAATTKVLPAAQAAQAAIDQRATTRAVLKGKP